MSRTTSYDLRGPILILAAAVLFHASAGDSMNGQACAVLGAALGLAGVLFMLVPALARDGKPRS